MNKESKAEKDQIIEFFLMCLKNWYYFVIGMVVCGAVAVVYLKVKVPVMQISAKVSIRDDETMSGGGITKSPLSILGMRSGGLNIQDETNKIVSQGYIKRMIKKLDLNKIYTQTKFFGLNKTPLYDQSPIVLLVDPLLSDTTDVVVFSLHIQDDKARVKIESKKKTIGNYDLPSFPTTIETAIGKFTFSKSAYFENYDIPFDLKIVLTNYDYIAQSYRTIVEANFEKKNSDIINLDITNKNVGLAKKILTEIINVYNNVWIEDKYDVAEKTTDYIDKRLDSVKLDLGKIDKDIQIFKDKYSLTDLEADVKYYFVVSAEIQAKLIEAQTQLKLVDIISDCIDDEDEKYELIPFSPTTLDPSIADVIGKYNEELLTRNELYRGEHGAKNSAVSSLDAQIDTQRKNLLVSLSNIKKGIQITVADLQKKENEFNIHLGNIPVIERDFISLKREQEIQQTVYTFLLEKKYETEIKSVSLMPKLKIIDEPYALIKPVEPQTIKVALTVLFLGGILFPFSAIYLAPYIRNYNRKRKEK